MFKKLLKSLGYVKEGSLSKRERMLIKKVNFLESEYDLLIVNLKRLEFENEQLKIHNRRLEKKQEDTKKLLVSFDNYHRNGGSK